jgi:hypothetical protein
MKMHILFRTALGSFALVALPCIALAKQDAPMVGPAVERAASVIGNDNTSTVVPVVIGTETAATTGTVGTVGTVGTASTLASGSGSASALTTAPALTPPSTKALTPAIERLTIQAGQRLSLALGAWLKSQSIDLSWEPAGTLPGRVRDVVIDSAWLASQTALEPTLTEVLAPFGLTAHVLRQRQTTDASNAVVLDATPTSVVVRNASNARP